MTNFCPHTGLMTALRTFKEDEQGAAAIEFAIVVALLFFILFALFDFGRIAFTQIMAENAVELAARTAVVRTPACAGVPNTHGRNNSLTPPPRFGTSCSANGGAACTNGGVQTCTISLADPTATEIWNRIQFWLPSGTQPSDVQFTYSFDSNLGFAGGPYTPMVTVDINPPNYQFVSPLAALAQIAGAVNPGLGSSFNYPTFSASLPAEDLNVGTGG